MQKRYVCAVSSIKRMSIHIQTVVTNKKARKRDYQQGKDDNKTEDIPTKQVIFENKQDIRENLENYKCNKQQT